MEGIELAIRIGEVIFLICAIRVIIIAFMDTPRSGLLCLGSAAVDGALYVWFSYEFTTLALILGAVSFICAVWIVNEAFKESVWSGLLNILVMPGFFTFYLSYYAYTEWLTWRKLIVGLIIAIGLFVVALAY